MGDVWDWWGSCDAFAHLERLEVDVAEVDEIGGESEVVSSSGGAS